MESLNQLIMMFLCMFAGYALLKLKYLTYESIFSFNKLLIHCALPCLIISSVGGIDLELARAQAPVTLALAMGQFVIFIIITVALLKILRVPKEQHNLYIFMNLCTNTGFVCMPIIAAVYGDQTLILSAIFVLACNLFTGSMGFALLASARDGHYGLTKFRIGPKSLWNAPLVASVIALIMLFAGIQLPDVLQGGLKMMGGICTPVAMVIVGIIVASANLKTIFGNWRVYVIFGVRMFLFAVVSCLILAQFITDVQILATFVIMFAAPVGAMVPAFALNYQQDEVVAAQSTVISTLMCFIIYPVLVALIAVV